MAATARALDATARLVLDVSATPHTRVRIWEADSAETRGAAPAGAHGAVELCWIDDGEVGYAVGSRRFAVSRGEAMLVPSGVEHATTFPARMRGTALYVDRDVVAEIGDALGRAVGPSLGLVAGGASIAQLGSVLAVESKRQDRGALLAADAIAEAMVSIALRGVPLANDGPRVPRDPAMASAVRYIEASYAEPLTVDGMAREAHMSRFHFSRRFRDATGRSPYRYLVDVRLERAAELLRRGTCGVTEVALTVGFSDPSRFARMFRERFGATPACWAKRTRVRVLHLAPSPAPRALAT